MGRGAGITSPNERLLAEQQRIVAKLDAAFAEIDRAVDVESIKSENLASAQSSFAESMLANLSSPKRALEEVALITNGYAFKSGSFTRDEGVAVIKITNVGIKSFVETCDVNLPQQIADEHHKFKVASGDIVFALTRTIIAGGLKVAVVPASYDGALLNQRVAAVSAKQSTLNKNFLYAYLSSNCVRDYVLQNVNTLMQPNLSIGDLKRLEIPVPNKDEQQRIVARLRQADGYFALLKDLSNEKVEQLTSLKSAILSQELQPPQSEAA